VPPVFEFLASAIIWHHALAFTRPITVALQAKDCYMYKANKIAQCLVKNLERERDFAKFRVQLQPD